MEEAVTDVRLISKQATRNAYIPQQINRMKEHVSTEVWKWLECLAYTHQHSDEQGYQLPQNSSQKSPEYPSQQVKQAWFVPFGKLAQEEQSEFISGLLKELEKTIHSPTIPKQEPIDAQSLSIECERRKWSTCLVGWQSLRVTVNYKQRTLKVEESDKVYSLQLKHQIPRKSKKHDQCLVFQNAHLNVIESRDLHLRFDSEAQYKTVHHFVSSTCVKAIALYLSRLNWQENKVLMRKKREQVTPTSLLTAEKKRNLQRASQRSKQSPFQSQTDCQSINGQPVYVPLETNQRLVIQCCQSNPMQYRAKFEVEALKELNGMSFIDQYRNRHEMAFRVNILETSSVKGEEYQGKLQHTAFSQKIVWSENIYDQVLISRQQILLQPQDSFTLVFMMQNVDQTLNQNFIKKLQLSARNICFERCQVSIQAQFFGQSGLRDEAIVFYLSKFVGVFEDSSDIKSKPDLRVQEQIKVQLKQAVPEVRNKQLCLKSMPVKSEEESGKGGKQMTLQLETQQRPSDNHLTHRYPMQATQRKVGKVIDRHFLWNDWKRAEKGGLICKDEELVQRQKHLYKVVLKKFGETLISGKNIINFSLPVIVFKKESHLQSLAKSYPYAPIFVEKAAQMTDPLERMKFSLAMIISQNILSIHMEKPFNPILGETYQGYIDGCPIYLEQISHHPPVSAYYFVGRGFKAYGSIQPRISIGLNTGSGYSIYPHFIEFEDGSKIQYICAKIVIGGLMIGQRTFNFEGQMYAYDKRNRLFVSLNFGPIDRGFFRANQEPNDYFHGHIYKVNTDFEEFCQGKSPRPHPQKHHILQDYGFVDGIWNSNLNISGQQWVNFKTDLPYEFKNEQVPLPSDSHFREDLTKLLAGDLDAAQEAKEEMEQIQRNDRKLREQYGPSE